jgi:Fe-S cluster assembly protein SufD
MNSVTPTINVNNSFASTDFFNSFLEKRSWEPGWLADFRKDAWDKFIALPKAKVKDEMWRFSPRARLGYSNFDSLKESVKQVTLLNQNSNGAIFETFDQAILNNPNLLTHLPNCTGPELGSQESFLLGACFSESGFALKVKKNTKETNPFICKHLAPTKNQTLFQQNIITVEAFAQVTLIEYFDSENESTGGNLTNLSHINLEEGSKLTRIIIQRVNDQSTFNHLEKVELKKNAQFNGISLQLGGAQSRVESRGVIAGEGSDFSNHSLSLGRRGQLFDQRTIQHHLAPNGNSNLLFKNALLDESKSIFSGLIKVDANAQNTDSFQTNRNLLLSGDAEADSLPGLEILANEVKCSHGATTSKIDEQELFYLQSRGISKTLAEKLIILGFFEEIISKAGSDDLVQLLRDLISDSFTD